MSSLTVGKIPRDGPLSVMSVTLVSHHYVSFWDRPAGQLNGSARGIEGWCFLVLLCRTSEEADRAPSIFTEMNVK